MLVIFVVYRQNYFYKLNHRTLSALFILIGISMMVAGSFLAAFIWSVGNGQYDDDYTPSIRMLFDQPQKETAKEQTN